MPQKDFCNTIPPGTDIERSLRHVHLVPLADIAAVRSIVLKLIVKCLGDFWLNIAVRRLVIRKRASRTSMRQMTDIVSRAFQTSFGFRFGVCGLILLLAVLWFFSNANPKQSDKQQSEPLDDSHGVVLQHNAILCETETGLRQALVLRKAAQTWGNRLPQLGCHVWYEDQVSTVEAKDGIRLIRVHRNRSEIVDMYWVSDSDLRSARKKN
jgi:hypothetical protein